MTTSLRTCEHSSGPTSCARCRHRDADTSRQAIGAAVRAIRDAFADPATRRPIGPDGRPVSDKEWCILLIEGTRK